MVDHQQEWGIYGHAITYIYNTKVYPFTNLALFGLVPLQHPFGLNTFSVPRTVQTDTKATTSTHIHNL